MTNAPKTRRRPPSEEGSKRMEPGGQRKRPRVGLILALVVTAIVLTSIGVMFVFRLPWSVAVPQPWTVIAGVGLLLLGFIVLSNAFQALGVARAFGRELYASKKESQLITVGLYAYTRNPIYLGVILLLCGWFFVTLLTVLLIVTILFLLLFYFVAKWEERELTERLGTQFEQYRRAVPFFIPHPRLRKHRTETPTGRRRRSASPPASKRRRTTQERKRRT